MRFGEEEEGIGGRCNGDGEGSGREGMEGMKDAPKGF